MCEMSPARPVLRLQLALLEFRTDQRLVYPGVSHKQRECSMITLTGVLEEGVLRREDDM